MTQNIKNTCAHTHTHRNSGWHIPGHHYNDWGEALVSSCLSCLCCHLPVCVCLWKTDVWSELCVSVAGSHIAALSQFLRPRSDLRSARRGEHSRLSTAPVSQPWAFTLLSLSSKTIKTEEKLEWEGNREISTPRRGGKAGFKAQAFLSLTLFPKMSLLYNLAGPDLGLGKTTRAFPRRVGLRGGIIVEWCWMWSCRRRNAFGPWRERLG